MDEIYLHALKVLRRRDYTVAQLREKMASRYGSLPQETVDTLIANGFLDDARFAGNLVLKRQECHPSLVRDELLRAGVAAEIIDSALSHHDWPSLQDVLRAKMNDWKLQEPILRKEANRLFRVMARLGYPEDEIREELEQLHEQ